MCLGLFGGCVPPLHEVIGRACDASHPCPDALLCVAGTCQAEAPEDVVVFTADFEDGTGGFEPTTGARLTIGTTPHGAARALKVTPGETAQLPFGAQTLPTAMAVGNGRYCASAWALHGLGDGALALTLRAFGGSGGTTLLAESTAGVARVSTPRAYQALATGLDVDADVVSAVRLVITSASPIPADFSLDDVRVVRAYASCP